MAIADKPHTPVQVAHEYSQITSEVHELADMLTRSIDSITTQLLSDTPNWRRVRLALNSVKLYSREFEDATKTCIPKSNRGRKPTAQ